MPHSGIFIPKLLYDNSLYTYNQICAYLSPDGFANVTKSLLILMMPMNKA